MPVFNTATQRLLYSWMLFVDGENFVLRGQEVAKHNDIELRKGTHYQKDTFLWFPNRHGRQSLVPYLHQPQALSLRSFYYSSVKGDHPSLEDIRGRLWKLGFQPEVFKREGNERRAKGVDIALTKDMLMNAFRGYFEIAILIAGDGDYVPLVEEVKRLGRIVYVCFFSEGLNQKLALASDKFDDITPTFVEGWRKYLDKNPDKL